MPEPAVYEAEIELLREALKVARMCIMRLSGGHGHDSEQALEAIANALEKTGGD